MTQNAGHSFDSATARSFGLSLPRPCWMILRSESTVDGSRSFTLRTMRFTTVRSYFVS